MKKNIKHFVRHYSECQLTIKFRNVKRNVIHFNEIWFDRNQFFEKWDLNFIDSLSATIEDNRWIIICINYNIKWFIARIISNVIVETLTNFIIIDVYRNYKTFKKIIIDKKTNLWTSIMKLIFKLLNIKHKRIILYYFRINNAIKQFNDVLNHMFTKYCIDESIKNWNFYLNQVLFVIKIRTYIIIDLFSICCMKSIFIFSTIKQNLFQIYTMNVSISHRFYFAIKRLFSKLRWRELWKIKSFEITKSRNSLSSLKIWFWLKSKNSKNSKWIDMIRIKWYEMKFWTFMFLNFLKIRSINILSMMIKWNWSM